MYFIGALEEDTEKFCLFLKWLGGKLIDSSSRYSRYYWPPGEWQERKMFLAFLLTWIESGEFDEK